MRRLLIIESNEALVEEYKLLLDEHTNFHYKIVSSYEEAEKALKQTRYEFGVTDINVPGAKEGVVIALMNRYNLAPIIFTDSIDEDFQEAYESAQIVAYILKESNDILSVIKKLNQLERNKKSTLLVVDDSILHANFIKQNLILHKFKVLTAANGKLALEKLKNHPEIDFVVTNHRMKEMDGLELTQKIRQLKETQKLPILALTSDADAASNFLSEGVSDYLTKPFSRDDFYAKVYENMGTRELL